MIGNRHMVSLGHAMPVAPRVSVVHCVRPTSSALRHTPTPPPPALHRIPSPLHSHLLLLRTFTHHTLHPTRTQLHCTNITHALWRRFSSTSSAPSKPTAPLEDKPIVAYQAERSFVWLVRALSGLSVLNAGGECGVQLGVTLSALLSKIFTADLPLMVLWTTGATVGLVSLSLLFSSWWCDTGQFHQS